MRIPAPDLLVAIAGVLAAVVVPVAVAVVQRRWTRDDQDRERLTAGSRRTLLLRVREKWIVDVLEKSINVTGMISIRYEPWIWPGRKSRRGGITTALTNVLDEASGLLILGGPGSGKTTTALQLTASLLDEARRDRSKPIPVVFTLVSWATSRRPLDQWLVHELRVSYEVPEDIGHRWVAAGEILPVLDGLDEVPAGTIQGCLDAVLAYPRDFPAVQIILTCRTAQFDDLGRNVDLQVVELQKLSEEEMLTLLPSAAITTYSVLMIREPRSLVLGSPLMVNFLAETAASAPLDRRRGMSVAAGTNALFELYIARMLAQRSSRYSAAQTLHWLIFLAQTMRRLSISELRVDRLSLGWFESPFKRLSVMVIVAALAGSLVGAVDGVVYAVVFGSRRGLINGLVIGIFFALFDGLGQACARAGLRWWARSSMGLVGGLLLAGSLSASLDLTDGILTGASFILIFAAFSGRLRTEPVEQLTWSWPQANVGLAGGVALGACVGLVYGIGYGLVRRAEPVLEFDLFFMLAFGLFGALIGGLVPAMTDRRSTPNEGTRRSATLALVSALVTGPVVGVILGLEFRRLDLPHGFGAGVRDGVVLGLAVGTLIGGLSALQHVAIRIVLFMADAIPADYVGFLNQASDQLLLRKAGGGYLYVHRLLLDFVADLDLEQSSWIIEQAELTINGG